MQHVVKLPILDLADWERHRRQRIHGGKEAGLPALV